MDEKTAAAETAFLAGLIELQHGQPVEEKLRKIASKISWAKGWPDHKTAFWNAEAFMWGRKIEKELRQMIEQELQPLHGGRNLDLGCGAYSYLPSAVGMDFSEKMLRLNERCTEKVVGNLERRLPFPAASFDSATAIFVVNYVRNYRQLFQEVHRILRPKGQFVLVLSSHPVNEWPRQKEVNSFSAGKWRLALEKAEFSVTVRPRQNLLFFHCYVADSALYSPRGKGR